MMDIEGLLDQENSQLSTNSFTLSSAAVGSTGRASTSSTERDLHSLFNFGFPDIPPGPAANPEPKESPQTRKRASQDIDEAVEKSLRPSPPGRRKSQPKGEAARMSVSKDYPRRRALQACQICRARKTKCDNERPNCGNCVALGVECNYNEAPAAKYFCSMI